VQESRFSCDKGAVAEKVFGTRDSRHPGVAHFLQLGEVFVGGPVRLGSRPSFEFSGDELTPEQARGAFAERGWKTVVGFQTRNIPHRAHEHLLRLALEIADGVFVQPLVGRKKRGDCTPEAILTAYRALIEGFLPRDRVVLGVLSTAMRYAGPREAVFHAIVRRNYGCTHFIVGRDHAGVGDYYGQYEAQALALRFNGELGIQILPFAGPFHCVQCGGIVTERTCPHRKTQPTAITEISGTAVRALLRAGGSCGPHWVRPEVLSSLGATPIFIEEDDP
jgi:sulfate adenylyltransferase